MNLGDRNLDCWNLHLMLKISYADCLGVTPAISLQFSIEVCAASKYCEKSTAKNGREVWEAEMSTAGAACLSQSRVPWGWPDSRGLWVQREPHHGMSGALTLHVVDVTRRHDLWMHPWGQDVLRQRYAPPCTQTSAFTVTTNNTYVQLSRKQAETVIMTASSNF